MEIKKIENNKKQKFEHSNSCYYEITTNNKKFLFTAFELNKAFERHKKWLEKQTT